MESNDRGKRERSLRRFLAIGCLVLGACAHDGSSEDRIADYCNRWAGKYVALGAHKDLAAYREDLLSTCYALKHATYQPPSPDAGIVWSNPSLPKDASEASVAQAFGRAKADCIERGYVGQNVKARSNGRIAGYGDQYGGSVGGRESSRFDSAPAFDNALFLACMNGEGWMQTAPSSVVRAR